MAKMRKHKTTDEKDKEGQKVCERKIKKIPEMSEDQLIELRLRNKINKQNSRYVIPNEKLCKIERSYSKIHCSASNWGQKRLLKKDYCKKDYSKPQVRKHRKSKKEYLNDKLPFTRKSPKRLTPSEGATVSRTTSIMAKWQS